MDMAMSRKPLASEDVFSSPVRAAGSSSSTSNHVVRSATPSKERSIRAVDSRVFEPGSSSEALSELSDDLLTRKLNNTHISGPPSSPTRRPHGNTIPSANRPQYGRPSLAALLSYGIAVPAQGMDRSLSGGGAAMLRSYSTPVSSLQDLNQSQDEAAHFIPRMGMQRENDLSKYLPKNFGRIPPSRPGLHAIPVIMEEETCRDPRHFDTSDIEDTDTEIAYEAEIKPDFAIDPNQTPKASFLSPDHFERNPFFLERNAQQEFDRDLASARSDDNFGLPELIVDVPKSPSTSSHGGHSRESSCSSDYSNASGPASPYRGQFLHLSSLLPHRQQQQQQQQQPQLPTSPATVTRLARRPQFSRSVTART